MLDTSSLAFLLDLTSRSSQRSRIFFCAFSSTEPSFASIKSFFPLTSKVRTRFPVPSQMVIFSSPALSDRTIWCPDFVWIIRVLLSSA